MNVNIVSSITTGGFKLDHVRGVHRNFEKGFPLQLSDC